MINFLNKLKIIIFSIFINFLLINQAYPDKLKEIKVTGNERLAKETIILFSNLTVDDYIDSNIINNTFKKLFETDYLNMEF